MVEVISQPEVGETALADLSRHLRSGRLAHTSLVDGTGVLLDTKTLQVLALNQTGGAVLRSVADGATSEAELVDRVVAAFEVDRATAVEDVAAYLAQLQEITGL